MGAALNRAQLSLQMIPQNQRFAVARRAHRNREPVVVGDEGPFAGWKRVGLERGAMDDVVVAAFTTQESDEGRVGQHCGIGADAGLVGADALRRCSDRWAGAVAAACACIWAAILATRHHSP